MHCLKRNEFSDCILIHAPSCSISDKANRLDVGNAVNPCSSEKDNKLVICKSPNAVNPLVWDYDVSDPSNYFFFPFGFRGNHSIYLIFYYFIRLIILCNVYYISYIIET